MNLNSLTELIPCGLLIIQLKKIMELETEIRDIVYIQFTLPERLKTTTISVYST